MSRIDAVSGAVVGTSSTQYSFQRLGIDGSNNLYALQIDPGTGPTGVKLKYGQNAALATYRATMPNNYSLIVSLAGEVEIFGTSYSTPQVASLQIWNPGAGGSPSRVITYPEPQNAVGGSTTDVGPGGATYGPDGSLFVAYIVNNKLKVDVIAPGQSTPARTLVDTLAPGPFTIKSNFVAAVGADGSFYLGEYSGQLPDSNAGLYVFAPNGTESRITSMAAGIVGIDFDAAGNAYVACDNAENYPYYNGGKMIADTSQQVSVYSARATTLLRQINDNAPGVFNINVAPDGTVYLVQGAGVVSNAPANFNIVRILPGASTASVFVKNYVTSDIAITGKSVTTH